MTQSRDIAFWIVVALSAASCASTVVPVAAPIANDGNDLGDGPLIDAAQPPGGDVVDVDAVFDAAERDVPVCPPSEVDVSDPNPVGFCDGMETFQCSYNWANYYRYHCHVQAFAGICVRHQGCVNATDCGDGGGGGRICVCGAHAACGPNEFCGWSEDGGARCMCRAMCHWP